MQNIPGIIAETTTDSFNKVSFSAVKQSDQQQLFAQLFDQHSSRIENELALTPVSTQERMLDAAPSTTTTTASSTSAMDSSQQKQTAATEKKNAIKEEKAAASERDQDKRMTEDDLDEVRDDLKEYGFSDDEIKDIEDQIKSDEGMTWGQFVSTLAQKMSDVRNANLTDDQKENLQSFFAKFGFTSEESTSLIEKLQNGKQSEVMQALQNKLDALPEGQQLLLTKDEVEAFSAAMNFSKEFTSQLKEALGKNVLPKDMKEAFTMISQEMENMDAKDQNLVNAVGKAFVKAMGDESKQTSAAKDIGEAVDLDPRVGDEAPTTDAKADLKSAVDKRTESLTDANVRKSEQKTLPEQTQPDTTDADAHQDADETWNNFFAKLQDNSTHGPKSEFQAKTETIESMLKTGLPEAQTASSKTQAWEKIAAPKVMKQVENAFIKTLNSGTKELTLQLTPENLGKMNIVLQVNGKEVSATIKAENHDAAKLIADNLDIIKTSLENQGLKVDKLEVQAGLTSTGDQSQWLGQEQHNLNREREVMVAMRNHMRQMRDSDLGVVQDMQNIREQAISADQGIHVIA